MRSNIILKEETPLKLKSTVYANSFGGQLSTKETCYPK